MFPLFFELLSCPTVWYSLWGGCIMLCIQSDDIAPCLLCSLHHCSKQDSKLFFFLTTLLYRPELWSARLTFIISAHSSTLPVDPYSSFTLPKVFWLFIWLFVCLPLRLGEFSCLSKFVAVQDSFHFKVMHWTLICLLYSFVFTMPFVHQGSLPNLWSLYRTAGFKLRLNDTQVNSILWLVKAVGCTLF